MFQLAHLLASTLLIAQQAQPHQLTARITDVTVFPGSALVRRSADLPAGGGKFVISNLPAAMDPDSVRVRCGGADVVGIETRNKHVAALADDRIKELMQRSRDLQRELQTRVDEGTTLSDLGVHFARLLELEEKQHVIDVNNSGVDIAAWTRKLEALTKLMTDNRRAQRELGWTIEELQQRSKDVGLELGRADPSAGVDVREVIIELPENAPRAQLDLDYVVGNSGWRPLYDLRAARDAKSVELSYRAQVWQQTGEDWSDVDLALSTARPNLGAQGPDPSVVWLYLDDPRERSGAKVTARAAPREETAGSDDFFLGKGEKAKGDEVVDKKAFFASVEAQGLSVRFRLAQHETIQSRPEASTVLVGQARLEVTPEYFASPALDTNVWLRGTTKNSSAWTILPGRAAVYFGADFLGHAELAAVQPGEEFTLHLGADPALSIEHTQLQDLTSGPGVFSSKSSRKESYRIRLKNNGGAASRSDGSVLVFVREALPRSTDDRIKVELENPKPAVSEDERWKKDREEQNFLTWAVVVPRAAETIVSYSTKINFPEGSVIVR
jgi:uncharacterized protein (TIGR02231 family)